MRAIFKSVWVRKLIGKLGVPYNRRLGVYFGIISVILFTTLKVRTLTGTDRGARYGVRSECTHINRTPVIVVFG